MALEDSIMEDLLKFFDWEVRLVGNDITPQNAYQRGYADATAQIILDIGKLLGEGIIEPYKYEAYKRVMNFVSYSQYQRDYPDRIIK